MQPKLDDREIFVTHLPPKASTEVRFGNALAMPMSYTLQTASRTAAICSEDGVRFLLGNFGDISEARVVFRHRDFTESALKSQVLLLRDAQQRPSGKASTCSHKHTLSLARGA